MLPSTFVPPFSSPSLYVCQNVSSVSANAEETSDISIAMATIGGPKILFLDEPTLGLDVLARRQLWREIEALKKDTTIILTTHYMEEAQVLADRIVIMTEGKVRAVGTLEELEARTGKKGLEEVFVSVAEAEE